MSVCADEEWDVADDGFGFGEDFAVEVVEAARHLAGEFDMGSPETEEGRDDEARNGDDERRRQVVGDFDGDREPLALGSSSELRLGNLTCDLVGRVGNVHALRMTWPWRDGV